jgi:ATP-dependent Lhr-like helicase
VVLADGHLALFVERGGRGVLTFQPFEDDEVAAAVVETLRGLAPAGRLERLQIERVDGEPIGASLQRERLERLGFRPSYRGLVLPRTRLVGRS